MTTSHNEIRALVDSFVDDLSVLIRQAALEAVQSALAGERAPRAAAAPRKSAGRAAGAKKAGGKKKRVRRSSEDVQKLSADILAHVTANPGQRLGEIAKALGLPTKDARRPAFALVESGELKTTGQRGGTRYFAKGASTAGAGAKTKAKAKTKKKTKRKAS